MSSRLSLSLLLCVLICFCCGCGDEELAIEPIGEASYPMWGSYANDYILKGFKVPACVDSLQYYTIANYKHIPPDSLFSILNKYIYSRYPYEKYVDNLLRYPRCDFKAFFYEKSLFVDYRKYISNAIQEEFGHIYEYKHKLVAMVYNNRYNGVPVFVTVLYDVDKRPSNIKWEKEDTISVKSEVKSIDTYERKVYLTEVKSIAIYERRIYLRMEKFTKPTIYGIFMHLADENVDMGMPGYLEIRKVKNGYAINGKDNVYSTIEEGLESYLKNYLEKAYKINYYIYKDNFKEAYWPVFVKEGKVQLFIEIIKDFIDDEFLDAPFSDI